jgi:hypothetical protein
MEKLYSVTASVSVSAWLSSTPVVVLLDAMGKSTSGPAPTRSANSGTVALSMVVKRRVMADATDWITTRMGCDGKALATSGALSALIRTSSHAVMSLHYGLCVSTHAMPSHCLSSPYPR